MALGPGSIAFVGFNADGNDDFAIVALETISVGTVITFRDDEWNGTAWADANEGTMTWTVTSEITAGTIVTFNNQSSGRTVSTGTLAGENLAFNATSETVYAYIDAPTPIFLAAITNDGFSAANGVSTNIGLTIGSTAVQFTGSIDGMAYTGPRTGLANFNDYLSLIGDTANWINVGASGDGTTLLPFSSTGFATSGDALPPSLVSSTPADDANGVTIASDIVLTLSENVQKGAGDILIKLVSDDSVVQTIDVATAAVTVTGTTVTINPPADLVPNTAYYVEIPAGVIEDLAGNDYAGISGSTTFNFTTGAANVVGGITILDEADSLQGRAGTPQATNAIELVRVGSFAAEGGNAEVVSFDPTTDQLYILNTNGAKVEIVQIESTGALTKTGEINLATLTEFGGANSVAVKNGIVAVAYGNVTADDNGYVALFNAAGVLQNAIEAASCRIC